ncbi:hypothetical protein [Sphingomonas sp.]|uniref:VpaChn25_0724 family phage protein n=1 Tax=Sphingomonas sp. TaxID=28214 RepID=UPI003CC64CC9
MTDPVVAEARLILLKELARSSDGRSNDLVLDRVLDAHGFRRSRDWLRTQLRALAELGAIDVREAGSVVVAELKRLGRDHVDRRGAIESVARPADAE